MRVHIPKKTRKIPVSFSIMYCLPQKYGRWRDIFCDVNRITLWDVHYTFLKSVEKQYNIFRYRTIEKHISTWTKKIIHTLC
jgi:hypothetical protein